MKYAVELLIDEPEAGGIRDLFAGAGSRMIQVGAVPHVSLAVFEDGDPDRLIEVAEAFFEEVRSFPVRFGSIGIFPGEENVVFLAPVVTRELLDIHGKFHERLSAAALDCHPYYRPGSWVPHCTITFGEKLPDTLDTVKLVHKKWGNGNTSISSAHVVRLRPVVPLKTFFLQAGTL